MKSKILLAAVFGISALCAICLQLSSEPLAAPSDALIERPMQAGRDFLQPCRDFRLKYYSGHEIDDRVRRGRVFLIRNTPGPLDERSFSTNDWPNVSAVLQRLNLLDIPGPQVRIIQRNMILQSDSVISSGYEKQFLNRPLFAGDIVILVGPWRR